MRVAISQMEPLEGFANYGARELARLTHSAERTARRWIHEGCAPRLVVRFLQLIFRGTLGAICQQWEGWRIDRGKIIAPNGYEFTPGELLSIPVRFAHIRELERAVRELERERLSPIGAVDSLQLSISQELPYSATQPAHVTQLCFMTVNVTTQAPQLHLDRGHRGDRREHTGETRGDQHGPDCVEHQSASPRRPPREKNAMAEEIHAPTSMMALPATSSGTPHRRDASAAR